MMQPFDFDEALKTPQKGQALTGKDDILPPVIKQLTETALSAELDSHLANDIEASRRNGATKKTMKTQRETLNEPLHAIAMALSNLS
ncbi:hypothetical protein PROVRETT_07103 [Providencia rettgeri DSM 1131]|nr:hypothetical protein PROVRETT_07103 [Providencia rettgeri DSM 1131]